jgi:ribosomal protein S18 acetylase RimI-like enzyme
MNIRATTAGDRDAVAAFMTLHAGSPLQTRKGELLATHELPGFVMVEGERIVGFASHRPDHDGDYELAALFAESRQGGIGSELLQVVVDEARLAGARVLWLITTNDNLDAMRFYQRRGFRLLAVYPGAVDEARRAIKPEIPEIGEFGIPIRDEVEFVLEL